MWTGPHGATASITSSSSPKDSLDVPLSAAQPKDADCRWLLRFSGPYRSFHFSCGDWVFTACGWILLYFFYQANRRGVFFCMNPTP